jgi:signal transduction histidine kinase
MRLGMQHLRRVYRDRRPEFDRTLEETADRMLAEIDRLDTIARAFSRFAAPAGEEQPLHRIDSPSRWARWFSSPARRRGLRVRLEAQPGASGAARAGQVKEVVVNLLENAGTPVPGWSGHRERRLHPGRRRRQRIGRPASRIFEPRFSTTTSGSGLGCDRRRLVEGGAGLSKWRARWGRGRW